MCIRDRIEGAHAGKGLGHEFLRHIERSAIILHVVDLTGGYEGRDPVEDYEIIKRELELYAPELAERPCIVVGNKIDMPGAEEAAKRLAEVVRRDSIARAGGDEFATSPLDPRLIFTTMIFFCSRLMSVLSSSPFDTAACKSTTSRNRRTPVHAYNYL